METLNVLGSAVSQRKLNSAASMWGLGISVQAKNLSKNVDHLSEFCLKPL